MALTKIATIQDISGLGRCSLTAAIPVLSAMGVQACPLPTAVLSNQTGFDSYAYIELTDQMAATIGEWKKLGVRFDAVTTGFLMDVRQAELVSDLIDYAKAGGALILVDPVLGDDGSIYPVFDDAMLAAMKTLVQKADIITPNLTEAYLLTGAAYSANPDNGAIRVLARKLADIGPQTVVISGIGDGDKICNFAYSTNSGQFAGTKAGADIRSGAGIGTGGLPRYITICNRRIGGGYSGTGDLLAAIICGSLVRGESVEDALDTAASFIENAVAATFASGSDPREGIAFEPFLHLLNGGNINESN